MGEALERLREKIDTVPLAARRMHDVNLPLGQRARVESHTRISRSGHVVDVAAYTRSLGKMSNEDLSQEVQDTSADRTRRTFALREVASRQRNGTWFPSPAAKKYAATLDDLDDAELEDALATVLSINRDLASDYDAARLNALRTEKKRRRDMPQPGLW